MKYMIHVHMPNGEIRKDLFFESLEEIENYVRHLKQEEVSFHMVAVYDAETREAIRVYRNR